jgi:hypothetical protein
MKVLFAVRFFRLPLYIYIGPNVHFTCALIHLFYCLLSTSLYRSFPFYRLAR